MGYDVNPNGSDFNIVTVVLLYSVFPTLRFGYSSGSQHPVETLNVIMLPSGF